METRASIAIFLAILFARDSTTSGFCPSRLVVPDFKQRQRWSAIRTRRPIIVELKNSFESRDEPKATDSKICDLNSLVQVYDAAFSPVVSDVLHALAVENSFRTNSETTIFVRPPWNKEPLTPLEHAIDSALTALKDPFKTVEYWSREEFMNIDAHVDIAEIELDEDGVLNCPAFSHVLYLKVKEGFRGPTCVFPKKLIGWDISDCDMRTVDLVTVPVVQGRILRFPGSAMHAVPCPANRWLLPDAQEKELRRDEEENADLLHDYDGNDEDDCDECEEDFERSVLLFNTWSDAGPLPRGSMSNAYSNYFDSSQGWEQDYGVNAEWIHCNPLSSWQRQLLFSSVNASTQSWEESLGQVRVSLMGEQNRRIHPSKTVELRVPMQNMLDALEHESRVTHVRLVEDY